MHKLPLKEKLLNGGAWAFLGRLLAAFSLLALNAVLARMLPPEDMGVYFLTFSLVSFGAIIAQLGLPKVVVRFVAGAIEHGQYADVQFMVRWSIIGNLLGATALSLLLFSPVGEYLVSTFLHNDGGLDLIIWVVLWIFALSLLQLLAEVFRGFHDLRLASLFGGAISGSLALAITGTWWLVYGDANIQQALMLSVFGWAGTVFLSLFFILKRVKSLVKYREKQSLKLDLAKVSATAWPLWLSDILLFVLLQVDLWIVGLYCPSADTALYGAAARFMIFVALPLMLVNAVVQPMIAAAFAKGELTKLEPMLRATATLASLTALIALLVLGLYGDWILGMVFGEFYKGAYWVMITLMLGKLGSAIAGSCGAVLVMAGEQKMLLIISFWSCLLMLVLSVPAVDSYGMVGIAVVASSVLIIQNLLMFLYVRYKLGINTACTLSVHNMLRLIN